MQGNNLDYSIPSSKTPTGRAILLVLVILATTQCYGDGIQSMSLPKNKADIDTEDSLDPNTMPYFDSSVPRNLTQVVGQHAFLLCRVLRMKDKSVSWIRKRDLHILTAGIYTYTTDQRFVVIHSEKSENWTLQIKFSQERDAGIYECQVNTEPKISMAFHLTVIESKAKIIGGSDVYVKSGNLLRLTCEVEHGPHDIAQVFWYHGSNIIDPYRVMSRDSDIRVQTQQGDLLRSHLTISRVRSNDSGNYTCSPTMSAPASIIVHVISGEHPAAMHHRNGSPSILANAPYLEYFLLLICVHICIKFQFNFVFVGLTNSRSHRILTAVVQKSNSGCNGRQKPMEQSSEAEKSNVANGLMQEKQSKILISDWHL